MNQILNECMLTSEQRHLIVKGIEEGKKEFQAINAILPETITKKHSPFLQSDLINTHVLKSIENNPHLQVKVYPKKAGFHPYIALHDTVRNIYILLSKLPKSKYILNPSGYRGEFSSGNFGRLLDMGIPEGELVGDLTYQESFDFGIENQPFGIVVCYDGKSDVVFEGALRPDQEDWIYKEDITEYINLQRNNLVVVNSYKTTDIEIPLKSTEEEIVIKLKSNTSS
jgi:hypothetical protein